jgi:hypothetical protein
VVKKNGEAATLVSVEVHETTLVSIPNHTAYKSSHGVFSSQTDGS